MKTSTKRKPARNAPRVEAHEVKAKPDPIFRLIADHEAACAACGPKRKVTANMLPSDPRYSDCGSG
jgi:hypothetical protein